MKSFLCLLGVCLPLFVILAQDSEPIVRHFYEAAFGQKSRAKEESARQLRAAQAAVARFATNQSATFDGPLGLVPITEPPDDDALSEPEKKSADKEVSSLSKILASLGRTLGEKYASHAKAESVVKSFVNAYQGMKDPPADLGEVNPAGLKSALLERAKMKGPEEAIDPIFADSRSTPGQRERAFLSYVSHEFFDTLKAEKLASQLRQDPFHQAEIVRDGSVLVLVIQTPDLVDEPATALLIDTVLESLRRDESSRSALVGGSFCLVRALEAPPNSSTERDRSHSAWPGGETLPLEGSFERNDARLAFLRAVDTAEEIVRLRNGKKLTAVRIIYRSTRIPTGSSSSLGPGFDRLINERTKVGVHWIANDNQLRSDAIERWFPRQVSVLGRGDNDLREELTAEIGQFLREASR